MISSAAFPVVGVSEPKKSQSLRDYAADDGFVVYRQDLPDELEVTAWTDNDVIMGVRHKRFPVEGIQFHPESIMTRVGKDLLQNFLEM